MKIRAGFELLYDCPQPTPMILQVSVHPSRQADLISWDGLQVSPPIPANTYHDTFGNFCHVIRAPAGRLRSLFGKVAWSLSARRRKTIRSPSPAKIIVGRNKSR